MRLTRNQHHYAVLAKLETIQRRVDQIAAELGIVILTERAQMADLAQLTNDVAANGDAVQSAVQLLVQLHDDIVAAGTDPAALAALAEQLEQQTQALAAAVVENTPAGPAPTP